MVNALTQRHRAQQLLLRRATYAGVSRLWSALDFNDLDASYPRMAVPMAQMVERNRQTSSGLAATYVRNMRKSHKITGRLDLLLAEPLIVDQFTASLHTVSVASLKRSTGQKVAESLALANALTETQGAMARLVMNAGRETVTRTVTNDPRAAGWQRVLGGGGCDFCRMLAGRGDVYREGTADFEAHDHCGCSAEPVYE